jgi:hypothetical protein
VPAGTACDDNDVCNGREACDDMGMCQPGPPPACDDGYPYTSDWCDPFDGCVHALLPGSYGDCNGDGVVTVEELVAMVNDALSEPRSVGCAAGDTNQDGRISVDELVTAIRAALLGDPSPPIS